MTARFLSKIPFFILLVSCANPKYAPATESQAPGNGSQKAEPTCTAKFEKSGQCVSLAWEKMPTETDFGSFTFKTFRLNQLDGSPVLEDTPGTVAVILWHSSMGHGSSPVTVERLDTGTYRASNVFFTMRGTWDIRFQLKDRANVTDQAIAIFTF